jgi:hypothetical protein
MKKYKSKIEEQVVRCIELPYIKKYLIIAPNFNDEKQVSTFIDFKETKKLTNIKEIIKYGFEKIKQNYLEFQSIMVLE